MYSIFIKNHLCSKRRDTHLDHEQFYNNVVGSFVKAVMVEEILLIQCRQKTFFVLLNYVANSVVITLRCNMYSDTCWAQPMAYHTSAISSDPFFAI